MTVYFQDDLGAFEVQGVVSLVRCENGWNVLFEDGQETVYDAQLVEVLRD